jgi:hypothetical protein
MKTDRRTEEDTREGTLAKRRLLGVNSGMVAADGAARGAAPGRSSRIANNQRARIPRAFPPLC